MAPTLNISHWVSTLRRMTYVRYIVVSGGALVVDMGVFLMLLTIIQSTLAASAGYCAGILAHWWLSSRKVFAERTADKGMGRTRQKALFVGSALLGLGITVAIMAGAEWAAIDPRLAKLIAIAVSFQVTFLIRNHWVFRV